MKVLMSAESFGYGPITTGCNIASHLKKYDDVSLDFIGSGIALEQAKMSKLFDNFIVCDTNDFNDLEKNIDTISQYNIFLSSENVNGAIFFQERNLGNVYYVDNLVWMWYKIPKTLCKVKKFFISEIIPCKKNFVRIGKEITSPIFVGPIRKFDFKKVESKNQLIINIGGAESFLLDHQIIVNFYNKLLNDILSVEEMNKFNSILICGGSGVLKQLNIKNLKEKVEIQTLSHEKYLEEMNKSTHCIMASGLGNFIETVGKEKNILYLPPINYSQFLQLDYYKHENLGFSIINWNQFDFYKPIRKYLDEETGVNKVIENVKKYLEKDYSKEIKKVVKEYLLTDQEKYYTKRKNFVDKFDKDSAQRIAQTIYEENK